MYDYAHPFSDAHEGITHSICTLEFEDHRPFYDWVVEHCPPRAPAGQFARLNLTFTVLSRGSCAGPEEHVTVGTIRGYRRCGHARRGFTPGDPRICEGIASPSATASSTSSSSSTRSATTSTGAHRASAVLARSPS